MDEKCIFCAIVEKKIPAFTVYEDNDFIAFLDIRPLNEGHTLIVSKKHYRWTYDVPEFGGYWEIARKISSAQLNSLDAKFVQFVTAGLGVSHAHIHVIPRFENDGHGEHLLWDNVKQFTEAQFKDTAQKIKSSIPVEQPKVEEIKPVKIRQKKVPKDDLALFRRDLEQT